MAEAGDGERVEFRNRRFIYSCYGLVVDERGITELWSNTVFTPWSEVYGVHWQPDRVVVRLAGRELHVDRRFGDWQRFGRIVEARGPLLQHEAYEIPAATIAGWLGIPEDDELVCGSGWQRFAHRLSLWLVLAGTLLIVCVNGARQALWYLPSVLICLVPVLAPVAEAVRADVRGVHVRRRGRPQSYAWSEIVSVGHGDPRLVTTRRGRFKLSRQLTNLDRLIHTLIHVAAANAAGAALPSDAPMTDAAISRLTGDDDPGALSDRGLSREQT